MVEMTTKKRTSNPALSVAGSCKGNLKPKVACMEDIIFCITPGDCCQSQGQLGSNANVADGGIRKGTRSDEIRPVIRRRSEEHTSELQSLRHLVCRLLLEKKNKTQTGLTTHDKKVCSRCMIYSIPQ